jgi:hypothetical protein
MKNVELKTKIISSNQVRIRCRIRILSLEFTDPGPRHWFCSDFLILCRNYARSL